MNFYQKIQELQDQQSALTLQRQLLEQKIKQREEFTATYHSVKAQELQDEIAKIEIQKIKSRARNQNLLKNIQSSIKQDQESTMRLQQMRQNLEEQKKDFVNQLNRRDPNWHEVVRKQRDIELRQAQLERENIQRDIRDRQVAIEKEKSVQKQLTRIRNDIDGQQNDLSMLNSNQKYLQDDIKRNQAILEKDNQNMKQMMVGGGSPTKELYNEGGGQQFASQLPDASISNQTS